ncbi:WxL domain-containing protein [Enterococcus termitis]|uniref:WxL domain-containing protein n=1 Tax=Enterococcus termitis TaxID=332950 RepID=A0A1E5GZY5_9ENTE|nr:WxL domain-containing protein [Enterococcus termitis]OEG18135.1 hypothetical protein BCR25_16710 [Enterococcus termitis]
MLFSNKISAQERSVQLSTAKSTVQIDNITEFSIGLNSMEESIITVHYPKSFQLEEEKFRQENSDKVQNIEVDSKKQQLSFMLKNKEVKEILFSGRFLEKGEQQIAVQLGKEKEQLIISVEESDEKSSSDKTDSSTLEQTISTQEKALESSSDQPLVEKQPKVDTLPSFDWNLLNKDGLDLSSFEKVSVNTPVKLTGGVFDKQQREYYMFFGHIGRLNTYTYATDRFEKQGNMHATLGEKASLPLLAPMMIGVKKQTAESGKIAGVFGYDYNFGETTWGSNGANFDIGEISSESKSIMKSGVASDGPETKTWIISQYVKENEIVSYGYFAQKDLNGGTVSYLPVRVHGYIVSQKNGRIRYDVSYYNDSQEEKDYAMTYGAHMDVGGAHENSKLFSYGESGLYFHEPDKTPVDKIPARIYFYTNNGYGNKLGPTDYKTGDLGNNPIGTYKISYWSTITMHNWLNPLAGYTDPYEPWDGIEPVDYQFPLTHPIFALRWDKLNVKPKEVGTGSLDLSIEEPAPVLPVAQKTYKNETSSSKENHVGDTLSFSIVANNRGDMDVWEQVKLTDELPKELELDTSSLTLVDASGKESPLDPSIYDKDKHEFNAGLYDISPKEQIEIKYKAKIISGMMDQTIINKFTAANTKLETAEAEVEIPISEKLDYKLKEEVFHEDGSVADKGIQGETLTYKTTILNPHSSGKLNYKSLQGFIPFDANLENVQDATLKDESGKTIGTAVLNDKANTIFYFDAFDKDELVPINQNLYVEYKATVKQDTPDGTLIKATANFWAEFTNGSSLDQDKRPTSNEVQTEIMKKRGDLVFVSAPKMLDFGDNLKILPKNQTYPIASKDDALVVEDHRGTGEHWSMTATLLKELSSKSGHKLANSLHYKDQKQEYIFTVGNAIPIIEKETLNEQGVDISAEWSGTKNGPFLDVKAGQPRAEKYSGSIKWTLQDVPANNQE